MVQLSAVLSTVRRRALRHACTQTHATLAQMNELAAQRSVLDECVSPAVVLSLSIWPLLRAYAEHARRLVGAQHCVLFLKEGAAE